MEASSLVGNLFVWRNLRIWLSPGSNFAFDVFSSFVYGRLEPNHYRRYLYKQIRITDHNCLTLLWQSIDYRLIKRWISFNERKSFFVFIENFESVDTFVINSKNSNEKFFNCTLLINNENNQLTDIRCYQIQRFSNFRSINGWNQSEKFQNEKFPSSI